MLPSSLILLYKLVRLLSRLARACGIGVNGSTKASSGVLTLATNNPKT